jgi:hypothetical protein
MTASRHTISEEQRMNYQSAIHYIASRREKKTGNADNAYPLCRGDLLLLVMLIDQEMKAASPSADLKRLAAIREKLGDMVCDAPEMTKEEAQQFR